MTVLPQLRRLYQRVAESSQPQPHDSELVVAIFRALVIVLVLVSPQLTAQRGLQNLTSGAVIIVAAVYNLLASLAYYFRLRVPFRRQAMVAMDLVLVTLWLHLSGGRQSQLFPLYYLITIVAAMWFKVVGSILAATLATLLYIGVFIKVSPNLPEALETALTVQIPFLYLVAFLAGYLAEVEYRERRDRFQAQLLVSVYEHDLRMSKEIQRLLLPPDLPTPRGVIVAARTRPARIVSGGDFYDVIEAAEGQVAICIADVAGKSVRAQVRLPLLKYALRATVALNPHPKDVVCRLNGVLYEDLQPDMFIGLFYALLDPATRQMTYTNAGLCPPFLVSDNSREVTPLPGSDTAIGILEDYPFTEHSLDLDGSLVLYTDGIVHATNSKQNEFGEDRLRQVVVRCAGSQPEKVVDTILAEVERFEDAKKRDDLTLLVVQPARPV